MAGSRKSSDPYKPKPKKVTVVKQHEISFLSWIYFVLGHWTNPNYYSKNADVRDKVTPAKMNLAKDVVQNICAYLPCSVLLQDIFWYDNNKDYKKRGTIPKVMLEDKSATLSSNLLTRLAENFTLPIVTRKARNKIREKINAMFSDSKMVAKDWNSIVASRYEMVKQRLFIQIQKEECTYEDSCKG